MGEPLDPLSVSENSVIWNHDGRIVQGPPTVLSPVLQEYGDIGPEGGGHQRAWAPDDDDILIYGQTFRSPARSLPTTRAIEAGSYHSLSEETLVDPETPGDRPSVLVLGESQSQRIASVPYRTRYPRTPEEVEFLRVVKQVNPQGYTEASRRVDIEHQISIQRDAQSSGSTDKLDRHANDYLRSQAPATPEINPEDVYTGIHRQSSNVTHHFGSPLNPQTVRYILQNSRSSLRVHRTRGSQSQAETPSSTASPASFGSVNRSSSISTISSEDSHATANSRPTHPDNRKRKCSSSTEESISAAQREWDELSDDIQGNPAKKRRISAHIARESVIANYNANLTANRRSGSGSFQDSPLLRKSTSSGLRLNTLTTPLISASQSNPEVGEVSGRNYKPGSQTSSRASSFSTRLEVEGIPSISDELVETQANNAISARTADPPLTNSMPLSSPREPAALSTSPFQKTHSRTRPSRRSSTSSVTILVPGHSRVSKSSNNSRQKAKIQLPSPLAQEILDSSSSLSIEATVQPKKTQKAKAVGASQASRRSKRINERLSRL